MSRTIPVLGGRLLRIVARVSSVSKSSFVERDAAALPSVHGRRTRGKTHTRTEIIHYAIEIPSGAIVLVDGE